MTKQNITVKVDYHLDWSYGVSIEDLRKDLEELEKLGVTRIEVDYGTSYDSPYLNIDPVIDRPETDEEFNLRVNSIKRFQEEQRLRDLDTLAKLKQKYEQ